VVKVIQKVQKVQKWRSQQIVKPY